MEIYLGKEKFSHQDIFWNPAQLQNSHQFLIGGSGSGKTYRIRRILKEMQQYPLKIHVFDTQGDIETNPIYTSEVVFSNTSDKGLNPLKVNQDPDFGGVKRRIKTFITMIERYSASIGIRQEAVLRALLNDLYAANHIYQSKPYSWEKDDFPTMDDLRRFTYAKLKSMIFGGEAVIKNLSALSRYMKSLDKKMNEEDIENDEKVQKLRDDCSKSFHAFLYGMKTGREIEDYINYDSKEVLKSVYSRIESLSQMTVFKDNPPDFDENKTIYRYLINSLPREEQGYLVEMALEEIFLKQTAKGLSTELQTVIVLDECQRYSSAEDDHIINILSTEGRKYGIGMLYSTQDMANLNRFIVQNCGTKIVLAVDESARDSVAKKLGVDVKKLQYIQSRKSGVMQMKTINDNGTNGKYMDIVFD